MPVRKSGGTHRYKGKSVDFEASAAPDTTPAARAFRPARFAIIFGTCFLLGFGVLMLPPVQVVDAGFSRGLVALAHKLIRICGGSARSEGAVLWAPSGFGVEMKDGCNAVNVTILLWAAVIAFPATWRMRAWGTVAGSLVIQAVNVIRFITLFYIGQYSATWFDFAHGYLWESLIVLDTVVIFWLWVSRVSRAPHSPDAST